MAIISDNEFEHAINSMIRLLEDLNKSQNLLMNTYKTLPIKEKQLMIRKIMTDQMTISRFLNQSKPKGNLNSGVKFKYENLKNKYQSTLHLWRRIDELLMK